MVKFSGRYMMWAKAIQDQDQVGQSYTSFYVHRRIKGKHKKAGITKRKKLQPSKKCHITIRISKTKCTFKIFESNIRIVRLGRPSRRPLDGRWTAQCLVVRRPIVDGPWTSPIRQSSDNHHRLRKKN